MNASDWGKSNRELQEPCEYCGDKKELIDFNEDDWRFIGRFRQMTGKDKAELKNVVESLKMVNVH